MSLTITQNVLTGSKALGTIYQNTSGSPRLVTVSAVIGVAPNTITAVCDASATPTTQISWEGYNAGTNTMSVVFLVPNNFFYQVTTSATATLNTWIEADFTAAYTTTQTVATGSRSFGTTFQNTTGKAMFVHIQATASSANSVLTAFSDESSTPEVEVAWFGQSTNTLPQRLFFIVPAGFYYKVTTTSSTLNNWIETTIATPFSADQYIIAPPNRALSTVYKASSSALLVSVSVNEITGASPNYAISSDATNATTALMGDTAKSSYTQLVAAVPLNSFYKATSNGGTVASYWVEWHLDISVATPNVRDDVIATEAVVAGTPNARADVIANEALVAGTPKVRADVLAEAALVAGTPKVHCDVLSLLVIIPRKTGIKFFVQAIT